MAFTNRCDKCNKLTHSHKIFNRKEFRYEVFCDECNTKLFDI